MRKWIGYYENIIQNNLCDKIIDYSENIKPLKSSTYASHEGQVKNSEERVNGEKYYEDIKYCITLAMSKYMEKHKDIACKRHTDFRLNKYSEGGFMSRHIDNIHHSHGQEYGFPQASVLLFLNDDFKGGDFIISDITYKTKKGSAIVFPSNFMFPHEVKLVEKGTRYSIISWLM